MAEKKLSPEFGLGVGANNAQLTPHFERVKLVHAEVGLELYYGMILLVIDHRTKPYSAKGFMVL